MCPLPQPTLERCNVFSSLDDVLTTSSEENAVAEDSTPHRKSRREFMALGGEKHPLPWQASTGLSLFQRHASHVASPQAQATMTTASSPEHPGEEEL